MRTRALVAGSLLAAACATGTRTQPDASQRPDAILARAVAQAGGAAALERARALTWEGEATVHAGGRTVRIAGRWAVQPPDTAVVTTYDVTRGPSTARSLVVAAPRGWIVAGDRFTPMPARLLANERDEFYLYDVLRLVPLRAPTVTLTPIPPDSLGQTGLRVRQVGRSDVELYVNAEGRLAHLRTRIPDAASGKWVRQDVWLSGVIEAAGVRWPRELRLTLNGAPYFDLTVRELRVSPRLQDPLLAGPR